MGYSAYDHEQSGKKEDRIIVNILHDSLNSLFIMILEVFPDHSDKAAYKTDDTVGKLGLIGDEGSSHKEDDMSQHHDGRNVIRNLDFG